jgi:energy-converting hydrogenase B subunit Q
MPRRPGVPPAVALRVDLVDRPEAIAALAQRVAVAGGRVRTVSTVRRVPARDGGQPGAEVEVEVEGLAEADVVALLEEVEDVRKVHPTRVLEGNLRQADHRDRRRGAGRPGRAGSGQRGGPPQPPRRADQRRHDRPRRRERDAAAVRAVADLPRARLLVLAGSIMGGDISVAADEIRAVGIPIISLNMVGSITEHVDLVVSDPVQAGTMAVMAIADTAAFDLDRQRGRKF